MRIAYYFVFMMVAVVLAGCDGPREKRIQRLDEFESRVKKAIDEKALQKWAKDTIGKYDYGPGIPEETFPPCFSNVMDHGFMPFCYLDKCSDGDKCAVIFWRWIHGYAGIVIGVENKHLIIDWGKDWMEARYLSTNLLIYVD